MIEGLSHITLIVSDLAKAARLLETVFAGREVYSSDGQEFSQSPTKFFLINDLWIALIEGPPLADKTYNHLAFKVAEADLETLKARVLSLGLEVRESRPRVAGEGSSLYFYDDDNHLFELHTGTLEQRLAWYRHGLSPMKRSGFMPGQISIPDDFDRMGSAEIVALFGVGK